MRRAVVDDGIGGRAPERSPSRHPAQGAPEYLRKHQRRPAPSSDRPSRGALFAGSFQPLYRDLRIGEASVGGEAVPVTTETVWTSPFCALRAFARGDGAPHGDVLIVPPLSGHFSFLLRDLTLGLLDGFRVLLLDWANVRHVAPEHGALDLAANVALAERAVGSLRPGGSVVALCQGGIAALAALARRAARAERPAPQALVLIASPIDAQANPTHLVRLLRAVPVPVLQASSISFVPAGFAGYGRAVHPAERRLAVLSIYLARHWSQRCEVYRKIVEDDGLDPERFPFLDLYTSIMDIDAAHFIENITAVYHECALARGLFRPGGEPVEPAAISETALITIEGERDDVAAPGQTSAAHRLCRSVPTSRRRRVVLPECGHFSLFHGERFRRAAMPIIREVCADA